MPVRVQVHYTGQLSRAAGVKEQIWEAPPGGTIGELVVALAREHGGEFAGMLLDSQGSPRSSTLVVLDGEQAPAGWATFPLGSTAQVVLMTPIAGG
jgi:molybdopterin converting factor small subunit